MRSRQDSTEEGTTTLGSLERNRQILDSWEDERITRSRRGFRYGLVIDPLAIFWIWTSHLPVLLDPPEHLLPDTLFMALGATVLLLCSMPLYFRHHRRLLVLRGPLPTRHLNLWTWAQLLFRDPTLERVFVPLLSDLELEQREALEQSGPRAARGTLWRGYGIFWKTVGAELGRSLARFSIPDRPQVG
ncbi:MAG: hypothetical protein K0U98_13160 [Deltaproteobacteria bacterium]|nr:hypothetical protein [Deltaproteobacteria bacterium]